MYQSMISEYETVFMYYPKNGNILKFSWLDQKMFRIEAKNNSDIQRVAMAVKQAAALNS